jgi:hypothetical protein
MIQFKNDTVRRRYFNLHPMIRKVVDRMAQWSFGYDRQELVITESITTAAEDAKVGRKHRTHREARALDIRCRDWSKQKIKDFDAHFEVTFGHLGAISSKSGKPELVVDESMKVDGPHLHVQFSAAALKLAKDDPKFPLLGESSKSDDVEPDQESEPGMTMNQINEGLAQAQEGEPVKKEETPKVKPTPRKAKPKE